MTGSIEEAHRWLLLFSHRCRCPERSPSCSCACACSADSARCPREITRSCDSGSSALRAATGSLVAAALSSIIIAVGRPHPHLEPATPPGTTEPPTLNLIIPLPSATPLRATDTRLHHPDPVEKQVQLARSLPTQSHIVCRCSIPGNKPSRAREHSHAAVPHPHAPCHPRQQPTPRPRGIAHAKSFWPP